MLYWIAKKITKNDKAVKIMLDLIDDEKLWHTTTHICSTCLFIPKRDGAEGFLIFLHMGRGWMGMYDEYFDLNFNIWQRIVIFKNAKILYDKKVRESDEYEIQNAIDIIKKIGG